MAPAPDRTSRVLVSLLFVAALPASTWGHRLSEVVTAHQAENRSRALALAAQGSSSSSASLREGQKCSEGSECAPGSACARYDRDEGNRQCCAGWELHGGVQWCANPEGGACSQGVDENCARGAACGRFNAIGTLYQCCASWELHGEVAWCAVHAGNPCSDGLNENCVAGTVCGRDRYSRSKYTCCPNSEVVVVNGQALCSYQNSIAVSKDTLLWKSPFLMSHDAATGYMGGGINHVGVVKTQSLVLPAQLSCGVRAFDLRLAAIGSFFSGPDSYSSFEDIRYHHGMNSFGGLMHGWISRDQSVANTVPSLVEWSRAHPEELVLIVISHCLYSRRSKTPTHVTDVACYDHRFLDAFTKHGVREQMDCNILNSWTLEQTHQAATMEGGGKLLLIPGEGFCVNDNWEPDVESIPDVDRYMGRAMDRSRDGNRLFQIQAFQQQKLFVPLSNDNNAMVYDRILGSDTLTGVNLLEMNLICSHGVSISRALGATVTDGDYDQCKRDCAYACEKVGGCVL